MWRSLQNIFLLAFCTFGLIYASPIGRYLCLGLMTHDLPAFLVPLLKGNFIALLFSISIAPIAALIYWGVKPSWLRLLPVLIICLVVGSNFVRRPNYWPLRQQGLIQSATQMDAINRELAHHYSETGAYPATLQQLGVDTTTGMCAYPRVAYRRAFTNSPFSGYELKVETGLGLLNWDSFFFWPSQKYPKTIYGGEVEVIKTPGGVWAYVHE